MRMNALWNCKNPHQGDFKRVLCICSAGLLRSPTLAWVLSNRGYNTRAAGLHDYALVPVDEVLIEWADHIVVVEAVMKKILLEQFPDCPKRITVLEVPDKYSFRAPELIKAIEKQLKEVSFV